MGLLSCKDSSLADTHLLLRCPSTGLEHAISTQRKMLSRVMENLDMKIFCGKLSADVTRSQLSVVLLFPTLLLHGLCHKKVSLASSSVPLSQSRLLPMQKLRHSNSTPK